ncbi:MAG: 2,3-diaminopropionate biosynthesis protein SbnB [Pseudomonas sp.]|uniref:2,3-diaminopropionate biosynthesis protein SbnB n=1 Tax=Pseudomonas sp. TaxID=306 RepID=UPI0033932A0F
MPRGHRPNALKLIGAHQIEQWLDANPQRVFDLVRDIYLTHGAGRTVNPDSYFLRFPDSERDRIIALPASIEDEQPIAGIKWIASFPGNIEQGLNRASALLILNDRHTGYPLACLEGSAISAARTAAAAAVGAHYLHPTPRRVACLGVVGCGLIAFNTVELLCRLGWEIDEILLSDLSPERVELFKHKCSAFHGHLRGASLEDTVVRSDLLLFATSAVKPFVDEAQWFAHHPTVLHLSLRDLSAPIVLDAQNVADDVDHCLKAQTSLHLAEQLCGDRRFMAGDIAGMINGVLQPDRDRTRIFSPFGMGVLDLALGRAILDSPDEVAFSAFDDFFPTAYIE